MTPSSIRIALRLHPQWWRDRYGDEVQLVSLDMISDGQSEWRLATNLFLDAARQWIRGPVLDSAPNSPIRSQLAGARSALPFALVLPLVIYTMMDQTYRSSLMTLISGSPTLYLGWPSSSSFSGRRWETIHHGSNFVTGPTGPLVHGSMSWATFLSGVGAFFVGWITLLSLIALLVAWGGVRYAIRLSDSPKPRWRVLAWMPGFTLIVVTTFFLWVNHLDQQVVLTTVMRSGRPVLVTGIQHPTLARILGDVNLLLGLGLWIASVASLTFLASRVETDARTSRLPITLSRLVGRTMPLLLLGYAMWIVGLRLQGSPTTPGQVVVNYAHAGWWPAATIVDDARKLNTFDARKVNSFGNSNSCCQRSASRSAGCRPLGL